MPYITWFTFDPFFLCCSKVPPWTWHKVDYDQEPIAENRKVSLAASLFHFRPYEFCMNQPLFAVMIIPNLIKELFGWKTE